MIQLNRHTICVGTLWIRKNIPPEIKHILRLSRLIEYATPEQDFNYSAHHKRARSKNTILGLIAFEIRHDTDI